MSNRDVIRDDWKIMNNYLFIGEHRISIKQIDSFIFTVPIWLKIVRFMIVIFLTPIFVGLFISFSDGNAKNMAICAFFILGGFGVNGILSSVAHTLIIFVNGKKYKHTFYGTLPKLDLNSLSSELTNRN